MKINKLELRLYLKNDSEIQSFVPRLYHLIQSQALPGILIDVANYSHVPYGPGLMIIGHEGNYGLSRHRSQGLVLYYVEKGRRQVKDVEMFLKEMFYRLLEFARQLALQTEIDYFVLFINQRSPFLTPQVLAAWTSDLQKYLSQSLNTAVKVSEVSARTGERAHWKITLAGKITPPLLLSGLQ